jgi:hypothetical protein
MDVRIWPLSRGCLRGLLDWLYPFQARKNLGGDSHGMDTLTYPESRPQGTRFDGTAPGGRNESHRIIEVSTQELVC